MATPEKQPSPFPTYLVLFQMCAGHYLSRAIYVAAKLGIADLLANGPRDSADLAQATGMHAPSLLRLLRFLASFGVLAEPESGRFALTPVGEWLRSGIPGSRRAMALLFCGPMEYRAWEELEYSLRTGGIAFDKAFGMSAFEYIAQHPEEAAIFNEAMTSGSLQIAAAIIDAYDFSPFGKLVDVGGGYGVFLSAILKANPSVKGILFDMDHATEGGRKQVDSAGLSGRCEVVSGDFFEAVPPGADAYLLKSVIHDWDDERSVQILKNCHRVMAPQGKLLLVEGVIPERIEPTPVNQIMAGSDINMMVNVGGRERTDAEFRNLFAAAGFRLTRIIPTAILSVLEGVRE